MTGWVRRYWAEEDTWFLFELDAEGWVARHIELRGPSATPTVAASLAEWLREHDAGRIAEYQATYGVVAEKPIDPSELTGYEQITAADFERAWRHARLSLEGH